MQLCRVAVLLWIGSTYDPVVLIVGIRGGSVPTTDVRGASGAAELMLWRWRWPCAVSSTMGCSSAAGGLWDCFSLVCVSLCKCPRGTPAESHNPNCRMHVVVVYLAVMIYLIQWI